MVDDGKQYFYTYIVVPPTASTLISTTFDLLIVPTNTWSPFLFFTSFASPVSELSSNNASAFETIVPSQGGLEPFRTRTTSPTSSKSIETFSSFCPGATDRFPLSEPQLPFSTSVSKSLDSDVRIKEGVPGSSSSASAGLKEPSAVSASAVRALLYVCKYWPTSSHTRNMVRKTTESKNVVASPTPFAAGGWEAERAKTATEEK